MRNFFIVGLPRSRTTWLANALTTDTSFCYHEALSGLKDVGQLVQKIQATPFEKVGDSSCLNLPFWDLILSKLPEAKWVVIERDPADAYASMKRWSPMPIEKSLFDIGVNCIAQVKYYLKPLVCRYEEINQNLSAIASWLGISIHPCRARLLIESNIQVERTLWQQSQV